MKQRKSLTHTLNDLVKAGVLSSEQSEDIAHAPRWSYTPRELLSYLAALIITVGVIRTVAAALVDVSETAIATLLYLLAFVTGAVSVRLRGKSDIQSRVSEILEIATTLSAAIATGIVCNVADLEMKWSVAVIALVAIGWGLFRSNKSEIVGAILISAGVPTFIVSFAAGLDENNGRLLGLLMVVGGSLLIFQGTRVMGFAFAPRAAGSLYVLIGAMTLGSDFGGVGRAIPLVIGAVLFGVGIQRLAPEMLLAGAFCVLAGLLSIVFETIDNDIAQGLAIVASGLVVLVVLGAQMKRTVSRSRTETPAA
ncbi:MAG: hypothetical protein RL374_1066 [Actinomycetota bacterium]|jgi:hypothetical protein